MPVGGGGAACTENPETLTLGPFGQLTVMVLVPGVADDPIEMLEVMLEAELTVHAFTVMPEPKLQIAPGCKLAPVNVTVNVCPCKPLVGDIPLIVGAGGGAGAATVKAFV